MKLKLVNSLQERVILQQLTLLGILLTQVWHASANIQLNFRANMLWVLISYSGSNGLTPAKQRRRYLSWQWSQSRKLDESTGRYFTQIDKAFYIVCTMKGAGLKRQLRKMKRPNRTAFSRTRKQLLFEE